MNELRALATPIGGGHRIGLTGTAPPSDKEHLRAITALSDKLGVSATEVAAVFKSELARLARLHCLRSVQNKKRRPAKATPRGSTENE